MTKAEIDTDREERLAKRRAHTSGARASELPARWDHPEDYEYCTKLRSDGWAWEFLRRRPEYINEWHEFEKRWGPVPRLVTRKQILNYVFEITTQPSEQYLERLSLADKWGLMFLVHPLERASEKRHAVVWRTDVINPGNIQVLSRHSPYDPSQQPFWIEFFRIDLRYPLPAQLTKLVEMAKLLRKKRGIAKATSAKPRRGGKDWVLYLRALDGLAAGVHPPDIARELKRASKSHAHLARDFINSAIHKMQNYHTILAVDPDTPFLKPD